jgi:predicted lipoprotein with Yx(FWY)xxD motif
MFKKVLMVVAMSAIAATAFANSSARSEAKQVIDLKDGSTVYVFDNDKMAMESKFGRSTRMAPGMTMETSDGKKVTMVGDEVARLDNLLWQDSRSSRGGN